MNWYHIQKEASIDAEAIYQALKADVSAVITLYRGVKPLHWKWYAMSKYIPHGTCFSQDQSYASEYGHCLMTVNVPLYTLAEVQLGIGLAKKKLAVKKPDPSFNPDKKLFFSTHEYNAPYDPSSTTYNIKQQKYFDWIDYQNSFSARNQSSNIDQVHNYIKNAVKGVAHLGHNAVVKAIVDVITNLDRHIKEEDFENFKDDLNGWKTIDDMVDDETFVQQGSGELRTALRLGLENVEKVEEQENLIYSRVIPYAEIRKRRNEGRPYFPRDYGKIIKPLESLKNPVYSAASSAVEK